MSTTTNSVANNINSTFTDLQKSVTDKMNQFSSVSPGASTTGSFDSLNGILAKFSFFILVVIIFMILLNLGIQLISYFGKPSSTVYLINGMISGTNKKIIIQDPDKNSKEVVRRSNNKENGMEFTWSVWLLINDASNSSPKFQPIFVKGGGTYNTDNISAISNGPGVYLNRGTSRNPNSIRIMMDTLSTYTSTLNQDKKNNIEIINIPNIPLKKWFHLVIRCQNKYLDVYINGFVVKRRNLMNVPLQNYDDIRICDSGGFNGNLSNLIYYSYSLNAIDINNLALAGPNTTNLDTVPNNSYGSSYLSTMWYSK
jgi:hypothetical protein